MTTWRTDHTAPAYAAWQAERLAAWNAAHTAELTDWERRTNEAAFDVEPPEVQP